jgi:hypothetical protein
MLPRLGHLLYFFTTWIAVIFIAAGLLIYLYFAQSNTDPLGLVVVGWGALIWLGGRAIRY